MATDTDPLYFDWPSDICASCAGDVSSEAFDAIRSGVGALATTRHGGISDPPFNEFNLGFGADDPEAARENRRRLGELAGDDVEFCWLRQVHGVEVADADDVVDATEPVEADACISRTPGRACTVLTADCLPVLFADRSATVVAAAHAGWRGLAAGVLEATITAMSRPPSEIVAWFGAAIGPDVFEVGDDVYQAFTDGDPGARIHFEPSPWNPDDRHVADLYGLARRRLRDLGMEAKAIFGRRRCTYTDEERFYSYRRDGETGRMATAIWLR